MFFLRFLDVITVLYDFIFIANKFIAVLVLFYITELWIELFPV